MYVCGVCVCVCVCAMVSAVVSFDFIVVFFVC